MSFDPKLISRFKKMQFLQAMSEDEFRDRVVRPVFHRAGFADGSDYCGVDEDGKDCIFSETNKLNQKIVYVVQTKKGNINKSSNTSQNILTIVTQLKTALASKIKYVATKQKIYPDFAMLCTSGKINDKARTFICEEVNSPNIKFFDSDDLIPMIDDLYPELWCGIDAQKMPYLKNLKKDLSQFQENKVFSDSISFSKKATAVSNEIYVSLKLTFETFRIKKYKGKAIREPYLESLPAEALIKEKERFLMVLGDAGSGKSTVLKRIAYVLCEQEISKDTKIIIPVSFRAIDLSESTCSLLETCVAETQKISGTQKHCFSDEDLQEGRIIVLVDALDEVANKDERRNVLNLIDKFMIDYPRCKVILTSRDYTYLKEMDELSKYKDFRISKFDLTQAKKMVERLIGGKSLSKERMQEFIRRLEGVHGVDLNPLLVTIFVATSDFSRKDIPANITELFKKYTEMMLGRWDMQKGLSQQYQAPMKDFLLQKLAYEMHRRRITSITDQECKSLFIQELEIIGKKEEEIDLLIEESIYRSGLFRHIDNKIEFRHLLLQEYFAGRGIVSPEVISELIIDQWWQRALIFYFGEHPDDKSKILDKSISELTTLKPNEVFQAAVTVGLSLQACYLLTLVKRLEIYKWVVRGLSAVKDTFDINDKTVRQFPITTFILYYLFGRDAVAGDLLENKGAEIIKEIIGEDLYAERRDIVEFWIICGLIESGCLKSASELVHKFNPKDKRLLLAIHLGCFYIENLRISTKEEQLIAKNIINHIAPQIKDMRLALIDEFKTELLEIQQNKVKAIK